MPTTHVSATQFDARVDDQISQAAAFARPILEHLRQMVHDAVPEAREDVKWGRPFFTLDGHNLCFMAAFTKHCAFGFWSPRMSEYLEQQGLPKAEGAGNIGAIRTLQDLPKDLPKYIQHAADLIGRGEAGSAMEGRTRKGVRPQFETPPAFTAALNQTPEAKLYYEGLPPSCQREYLEWLTSAKRDDTRERRLQQAIAMLSQQRRFNDAYRK